MKLQIRPLLQSETGFDPLLGNLCRLCIRKADWHASSPGLGEFFICQPCIDKPEKPAGHSFMQRFLALHGGGGFFGARSSDRLVQEVLA